MANSFYTHNVYPQPRTRSSSTNMFNELEQIEAGFAAVEAAMADAADVAAADLKADQAQASADALTARIEALEAGDTVAGHLANSDDAHAATAITATSSFPGSVTANVQEAITELYDDHVVAPADAHAASAITASSSFDGSAADTVQEVMDEFFDNHITSPNGLTVPANMVHVDGDIGITLLPEYTSTTTVKAALAEIYSNKLDVSAHNTYATAVNSALSDHSADIDTLATALLGSNLVAAINSALGQSTWQSGGSGGASSASDLTVTPSGNLASTNAQSAFQEHQSDIDTLAGNITDLVNAVNDKASYTYVDGSFSPLGHTHNYAATSHTHSGYAENGSNGDITNLTGLTSIQSWPQSNGLHLGYGNTAAISKYLGVTNLNHTTGISYLFARQQKSDNSTYWEASLQQDRNGIAYLRTTGPRVNIQTYHSGAYRTPIRFEGDIVEFPENASSSVGGIFRLFGSGTSSPSRWDMYVTKAAFPNLRFNNASGAGVQVVYGATAWSALSDENAKTDLAKIEPDYDWFKTVRFMTGRYKTDAPGTVRSFNIANDWESRPEVTHLEEDGMLSMADTKAIPHLGAILQDVVKRMDVLEDALQLLIPKVQK